MNSFPFVPNIYIYIYIYKITKTPKIEIKKNMALAKGV
jgi:hypothetical protein